MFALGGLNRRVLSEQLRVESQHADFREGGHLPPTVAPVEAVS